MSLPGLIGCQMGCSKRGVKLSAPDGNRLVICRIDAGWDCIALSSTGGFEGSNFYIICFVDAVGRRLGAANHITRSVQDDKQIGSRIRLKVRPQLDEALPIFADNLDGT